MTNDTKLVSSLCSLYIQRDYAQCVPEMRLAQQRISEGWQWIYRSDISHPGFNYRQVRHWCSKTFEQDSEHRWQSFHYKSNCSRDYYLGFQRPVDFTAYCLRWQ